VKIVNISFLIWPYSQVTDGTSWVTDGTFAPAFIVLVLLCWNKMAHLMCIVSSQKIEISNWTCLNTDLEVWNSRNYCK